MWLYDFYIENCKWLSQFTRVDCFLPNAAPDSMINEVPLLILKLLLEMPFLTLVLFLPLFFAGRILAWMVGCWFGATQNIYKD